MSPEFETLNARIERLYELQISTFDTIRVLFGMIIDKGLLTAREATERLQAYIDEITAEHRASDKTMALRLLLQIAHDQSKAAQPRPPRKQRPSLHVIGA